MMGLLWALVDVDMLCWHDRISQTYLTSRESAASHNCCRLTNATLKRFLTPNSRARNFIFARSPAG